MRKEKRERKQKEEQVKVGEDALDKLADEIEDIYVDDEIEEMTRDLLDSLAEEHDVNVNEDLIVGFRFGLAKGMDDVDNDVKIALVLALRRIHNDYKAKN